MQTYTIKEISLRFELPASTLRYYEDLGLLPPVARTPNHQRLYTSLHIKRLEAIDCFKRTGLSLTQIRHFFQYEADLSTHIDAILDLVINHETHIQQELQKLQGDLAHIQHKVRYYQGVKRALSDHQPLPDWHDFTSKTPLT